MTADDRVTELEVKVAFQDKLLGDLDEVVRQFSRRVEVLERRLAEVEKSVESPPAPIGEQDDAPPHY